ncbi:unnamed protein product [Leptosia nina]|uniref:E3 ubiquitin-protein ligase n=1 Tax=Leptosia nina TaxID=320188 RepID=A0AAV1K3A5_9NEOP
MDTTQELNCAVCMQKYNHPAKLPCEHTFCFLCVKGVFLRSHTCPMCRTPIPEDYFENPVLINENSNTENEDQDDKYWWYYEGKDGWWSYDERSNEDIESNFNEGKSECKLLVAGAIYCVDFNNMIQYRQADPRRKRKIIRDTLNHPCKGIAGIRKTLNKPDSNVDAANEVTDNGDDTTNAITVSTQSVHEIDNLSHILRLMSIEEPSASSPTEEI